MPAYTSIMSSVLDWLNRTGELTAQCHSAIQSVVAQEYDKPWHFNQEITTIPAAANAEFISAPNSLAVIQTLDVSYGGTRYPLFKLKLSEMAERIGTTAQYTGAPYAWCNLNEKIRLDPAPDTSCNLIMTFIDNVPIGTATTAWLLEPVAYEWVKVATAQHMVRRYIHDEDLARYFTDDSNILYTRMLRRTMKQYRSGSVAKRWGA